MLKVVVRHVSREMSTSIICSVNFNNRLPCCHIFAPAMALRLIGKFLKLNKNWSFDWERGGEREGERAKKSSKSREEFAEILIGCLFSDFLLPVFPRLPLFFSPSFVFVLRDALSLNKKGGCQNTCGGSENAFFWSLKLLGNLIESG